MKPQLAGGTVIAGRDRRGGLWGAALSGLTPQVVVIIAALLLIRVFSQGIVDVIAAANADRVGTWFLANIRVYAALLLMATPMLIMIVATANLGPQHGLKRIAALMVAVVLSSCAGVVLRIAVTNGLEADEAGEMLSYLWPRYAMLGGMLTVAYEFYRHEVASIAAMQQAEIDRAAFEREMTEARLQVLQAQVEPHFLFNTLANVRRLYDKDRMAGRTMLESFMRYLEIALPRMREQGSTLGRDAELVEAFLRIHQVRMGQRLAFAIDIPVSLRAHPVPPMMLLTLVENAIKHGLNPSPQGGLVRMTARCEGEQLIVCVADTGAGFVPGSGAGTGLANIRARLAAQFGQQASLVLENNELGGATAMIVLPLAETAKVQ
jgi:signal transduction histidine kinase